MENKTDNFAQNPAKTKEWSIIGSGSFGTVYSAEKEDGTPIAVKEIKMEEANEGVPATALREILILRQIDHKNVVKYVFN